MKSITEIFPKASKSFLDANPQSTPTIHTSDAVAVNVAPRRGQMNKTETEFAMILEAMKRKGEILRYEFEGITLRWADMKYTPDFVVLYERNKLVRCTIEGEIISTMYCPTLIEIKGGHIWDRDIVRFKGARAYWPEFQFEMHQKKKGSWTQRF